jgi:hypothetical protein
VCNIRREKEDAVMPELIFFQFKCHLWHHAIIIALLNILKNNQYALFITTLLLLDDIRYNYGKG